MAKEGAIDAITECELLQSLADCANFVIDYYDSFIEGEKINIVMEYCSHGDLYKYIKK